MKTTVETTIEADAGLPIGRRKVLVMGAAALALAGTGTGSALAEDRKIKLGFVYAMSSIDAFVQMANGGLAVAPLDPRVEVLTAAPDNFDPQREAALFGPIAQTQRDGIVLQSLVPGPIARAVADATGSGIPMAAIDAPPPDGAGVGLYITADNFGIGAQLAEAVLALIPADAKGSILIGNTAVGVPPLEMRIQGMVKKIGESRPDLKIIGPVSTLGSTGTSAEVYAAWEALLRANPDAVAVLAPSAQDAAAWGLLAQRAGFKLPAGGFDLEAGNLAAVKSGAVSFIMSPNHWLAGYLATRALADAPIGKKPPIQGLMLLPGELVGKDNIDAIIARQASTQAAMTALAPIGDDMLANVGKYIVGPWPPKPA